VLTDLLDLVAGLPTAALYGILALAAAVENVFPPAPADTIVAFGAFLAARGGASLTGVFLACWLGNVAGALLMFLFGRRLGAPALYGRFRTLANPESQARVLELYRRWGMMALFFTRFVPAVRAVVPPLAGALHLPAVGSIVAISVASAIWYGVIAWLAYGVGSNWELLLERITDIGRTSGIGALVVIVLVAGGVYLHRRRRRQKAEEETVAPDDGGDSRGNGSDA